MARSLLSINIFSPESWFCLIMRRFEKFPCHIKDIVRYLFCDHYQHFCHDYHHSSFGVWVDCSCNIITNIITNQSTTILDQTSCETQHELLPNSVGFEITEIRFRESELPMTFSSTGYCFFIFLLLLFMICQRTTLALGTHRSLEIHHHGSVFILAPSN